jgi:hypothetical protein
MHLNDWSNWTPPKCPTCGTPMRTTTAFYPDGSVIPGTSGYACPNPCRGWYDAHDPAAPKPEPRR